MREPLISAVIPTYNYGQFVADAVRSALAQTYRNLEIIVVDDGSTDDTHTRLAPYLDRIRYVYQENQGLSAARNTGIRTATGTWVALLDSDDLWHPRKLELQARYLESNPEVALLGTGPAGDIQGGWPELGPSPDLAARPVTLGDLVFTSRFAPSSVLIHKKCFDRVGLFDTELRSAEDRDMWIRVAGHFPVARLNLPLFWYRVHGSNMCAAAARMEENELKMLRKAFAGTPSLRRRWLFWLKTYSYAYYIAAYRYGAVRSWFTSLDRFLRAFCLWPLPYRREEVDCFLARPRMLAVLLLRMLGMMRPESAAPSALAGRVAPAGPTGS